MRSGTTAASPKKGSKPSSSTYNKKQQIGQQTNFHHSSTETNEVLNDLTGARPGRRCVRWAKVKPGRGRTASSRVFVIQKSRSRKHRDERPYGARVATKASVNGCQITSMSMRLSIYPTKSRYDLLFYSVQESCKQENKGLFGRAPAPPKTAPALAPLVEWLLWWS
jgi:hypothetical protein